MIVMKQSHELGMSEEDVKDTLFSIFESWMCGQTHAIHPKNGKPLYYKHDVLQFVGAIKDSLPEDID